MGSGVGSAVAMVGCAEGSGAGSGVGFVCRKKAGNTVDLNTATLPAVRDLAVRRRAEPPLPLSEADGVRARKEAIGHVYGAELAREL